MTDVLCGRSATLSKGSEFFSTDPDWHPKTLLRGQGCQVQGDDGRWLIDYISGLGAISLGYPDMSLDNTYPANHWASALMKVAWTGAGFSLPHASEQATAERIVDYLGRYVPGWTPDGLSLRFGLSGSDAATMAVRLCRAATGRRRIVSAGYHGFADWAVSVTPPAHGITHPQYVDGWDGKEIECLANLLGDGEPVAALVLEPPLDDRPAGWWQAVRRLCSEYGAMLILDEVVSGLRYSCGGAAALFGVPIDVGVYGKAWGNGVPISFMIFPRELAQWFARNDPCFISSTHFGCPMGFAALNAVLDAWDEAVVDRLWDTGRALMRGLAELGIEVVGRPPHFLTKFPTKAEKAYFTWRMSQLGVLWNRPALVNLAHTLADVRATVQAAAEVKAEMAVVDVEQAMAGRLPQQLFEGR